MTIPTLAALFRWKTRGFWLDGDDAFSEMSGDPTPNDSLSAALLRSLEMGLPQAHMAVLLLLCPRIEELNITTPSHFATSMIARLLDTVLSKSYQMGTSQSLVYDPEQDESDHTVAQMFGVPSYTPSLQKSSMLQDLVRCSISEPGETYIATIASGCIIWSDFSCIVHELPPDEDWRLNFGVIGDAIARYTPNLESLHLQPDQWPHRHFSSDYPYNTGESLRQLEHLTSLLLNYDMIYGATDPEELSIDHYTAHSDKPGVSHSTLGRIVPKRITTLLIGPQEYTNDQMVGDSPIAPWQKWQVDDLNYFMQDTSFERLCAVKIALDDNVNGYKSPYRETVTKYGWEFSVERLIGLGEYCILENKGRSGVNST